MRPARPDIPDRPCLRRPPAPAPARPRATHKIVAPGGRVVRQVDAWPEVGREPAEHCGWRARGTAVGALRQTGHGELADRLAAAPALADLAGSAALVAERDPDDAVARLV